MEKVIRTALAAFGMSGQVFHAPFLKADPHFDLVRVYERTKARAREEYPDVEVVRSFDALLTDDIDLVVVNTPNTLHVPMVRQALLAGKHVVVEKPVAATAAQAQELCRLARQQGRVFTVYQNRRLDSGFLTLKGLIEGGELGQVLDYEAHYDRFERGVYRKAWKNESAPGVNILYDLGVHIIDQAYALFGLPREVYADFRKQRAETPGFDNFQVILYYENGLRAILSAGELVAKQGPLFAVSGTKGTYVKYGLDPQEELLKAGARPVSTPNWGVEDPRYYGVLAYDDGKTIAERTVPTVNSSYGAYYENLYLAITQAQPLLVPPQEAVDVLRILEAAQRSNDEKRRVAL